MPHLTGWVAYVLLHGEAVLGRNHALVEAELLAGAVVAAKEREHSVEHGPDFVNLVRLVHVLVRLIDQVQEAPEGNEAVAFHDFPETGGARDEVVAGPLLVAVSFAASLVCNVIYLSLSNISIVIYIRVVCYVLQYTTDGCLEPNMRNC